MSITSTKLRKAPKRLEAAFFKLSADVAAPRLLGKLLCRRLGSKVVRLRITETEAYCGEADTACHAHRGRTARTTVMYEPGGVAYIYLCYGMHEMLNIVTGPADSPEAVLIRGVEGHDGPGKLTRALGITRALNREDLLESNRLWLEDDGFSPPFTASPRIGIHYASAEDRARLWRFLAIGQSPKRLVDYRG
ncbi:MAG: DNA-3-methyladenine glycosylase [Kiritimatiellia bacterium]|jgi:DNA-3-methyladenine glycosylase